MRDSSKSEENDVHESQDDHQREIHRGVYASVVRTGKLKATRLRKNAYAARKSRKQLVKFHVNNTVVFSRRC